MESEDEFLSDVTSQEDEDFDEGTQDSDDGSLGQGGLHYRFDRPKPCR